MSRGGRFALLIGLLAAALAAFGLVRGIGSLRRDLARRDLPAIPSMDGLNEATRALIESASRAAVDDPLGVAALGRLAMVYHSYQFYDEAARVYSVLDDGKSSDYRWPYFHGVLEETRHDPRRAAGLLERAAALHPNDADVEARLGLAWLELNDRDRARGPIDRAIRSDPNDPLAALASARMAALDGRWEEVVRALEPILDRYPHFSDAHKEVGRAYMMMGRADDARPHMEQGAFGDPVDPPILTELYAISVPAILGGNPAAGAGLIQERCRRCHTLDRTFERPDKSPEWWAGTVRRMQRFAGRSLLTDDEAAAVAAYLASSRTDGAPADPR